MANDLEEFLKRAAAIRQQKAVEQRAEVAQERERATRSAPQPYTDRNRERVVEAVEAEPHWVSEPHGLDHLSTREEPILAVEVEERTHSLPPSRSQAHAAPPQSSSGQSVNADLLRLLSNPNGVKQAFLLKEILARPKF